MPSPSATPGITATAPPAAASYAVLRIAAAALTLLAAGGIGWLVLRAMSLDTGPRGLIIGIVLAALPVPLYVSLALWLDRFETEPAWMLAAAFLWGATAAPLIALAANGAIGAAAAARVPGLGAQDAAVLVGAPLVEELAKGVILLVLFVWQHQEFDGLVDGVVYAMMVALGFAMTENILYFGRELAERGTRDMVLLVVQRDIFCPLLHPLFTAFLGMALGLSIHIRRRGSRLMVIAAGLALAMTAHLTWNLATERLGLLLPTYVLYAAVLAGVALLAGASFRHEARTLHARLRPYVGTGHLTVREHHRLSSPRRRLATTIHCLARFGPRAWWACIRFHQAAGELAFRRLRDATGRGDLDPAVEQQYLAELQRLRALTGLSGKG